MNLIHGVLILIFVNLWNVGANDQATDTSVKCSGLCEVCVALVSSSKRDKKQQVVFRDSLNSKSSASAACGSFENKISSEGWGYLHVRTNERVADVDQAWAAGFVEGYV